MHSVLRVDHVTCCKSKNMQTFKNCVYKKKDSKQTKTNNSRFITFCMLRLHTII